MRKSYLTAIVAALLLLPLEAMAGCFSGPSVVDTSGGLVTHEMRNNCAGPAVVYWVLDHPGGRRTTGKWTIGRCSVDRRQDFAGSYSFNVDVDESKICVPKGVERPDLPEKTDKAPAAGVGKPVNNGDVQGELGKRLQLQESKTGAMQAKAAGYDKELDDFVRATKADDQARQQREKDKQREAQRIRQAAREADDQRTRRDLSAAKSQLCFEVTDAGVSRAEGRSGAISHGCFRVCGEISQNNRSVYDACYRECNRDSAIGGHCATIDPGNRSSLISALRRDPTIRLPDE